MCPPSGTDARAGAGAVPAKAKSTLIIWRDWKGELYAFCSRQCVKHYQGWLCDPNYPFEKATWADVSFGCIWCGGDLTRGTIWLSREQPADADVTLPS